MPNLHNLIEASMAADRMTVVMKNAEKHVDTLAEILKDMQSAGVKPSSDQLMMMWKLTEKFQDIYTAVEKMKRS